MEMILFCLQSFFQNAETSKRLEEGDGRLGIPEWDNMVQLPKAVVGAKIGRKWGNPFVSFCKTFFLCLT